MPPWRLWPMDVFLWTLQFAGLAIVVVGLALERRTLWRRR